MIKNWRAKRLAKSQLESPSNNPSIKDAMSHLFRSIGQKHGQEVQNGLARHLAEKVTPLARKTITDLFEVKDHKDPGASEKLINHVHRYLTDPETKKHIKSQSPLSLHGELDRQMEQSYKAIIEAAHQVSDNDLPKLIDLNKSIDEKQFKQRIKEFNTPSAGDQVDHTFHMEKNPSPEWIKKIFSAKKSFPSTTGEEIKGQSSKMVFKDVMHQGKKNTLMIKPYHITAEEDDTGGWCPHSYRGWATTTTKSLFDAGKIGHLCEKVTTHEHKDQPFTVHHFDREAKTEHDAPNRTFRPPLKSMHQINAMDFLANNLDRHSGNIMYSPVDEPLAIDHERNFQYQQTVDDHWGSNQSAPDSFWQYLHNSPAMKDVHWNQSKSDILNSALELHDWWKENHSDIKSTLEDHLTAVKDINYRAHIRNNFLERCDHLTRILDNVRNRSDYSQFDLTEEPSDGEGVNTIERDGVHHDIKDTINRVLPKGDPVTSMNMLADYVNTSKSLSPKQVNAVSAIMKDHLNQLTPEQATKLYEHVSENPHFKSPIIQKNREKLDPRLVLLYNIRRNKNPEHARAMSLLAERRLSDHVLKAWRPTLAKLLQPKRSK